MKDKKNSDCPLDALDATLNFDSRDWSINKNDAWIYGITVGWGDSIYELAKKHRWNEETVKRLQDLHFKFNGLKKMGESSSDLKSVFVGEFTFEEEYTDPETEEELLIKKHVPWTTIKEIFKSMSLYVKQRKKSDYRP